MIKSYEKLLEMEYIASLKLEKDKKALEKIKKILHQEKDFILDKLIIYLRRELNIEYFRYIIVDSNNNVADILVKKDSKIFDEKLAGKDFVNFNVEELIDSRKFNNKEEIIITDIGFDEKILNLKYICDSLNYENLSYSDVIKEKLSIFIDYVINKNINNNN